MTIAIVGGGVSGLSLAYELLERGKSVVLLESSGRPGGLVGSRTEGGFLVETGPNSILDREPAMRALVSSLGLQSRMRPASTVSKRRFVFLNGGVREVPGSPPAMIKSNVLSFGGKLRAMLEPFSGRGPADEDESLASFARRHLGKEATEKLVDAVQIGIFAGDPERLSASAAFPRLWELEQQHRSLVLGAMRSRKKGAGPPGAMFTFDSGLQALTDELAIRVGDSLKLHAEVRALDCTEQDGWRLIVNERGREEHLEAEQLVLATPSYVASKLLHRLHPDLASELNEIQFAAVTVVNIGFAKSDLPAPVEGFGYLIPERERRKMLGAIYSSSVFPHRAPEEMILFTCLVGGARHPELAAQDDGGLLRDVRGELALALGVNADPKFVEIIRWPKAIPQYNVGHEARLMRMEKLVAQLPGLHLHGQSYRGVGLNDCVRASAGLAARIAPRDD
ncbi:MAG: protoporphyrinogen oxidase [Myxococcaceae bacterium]